MISTGIVIRDYAKHFIKEKDRIVTMAMILQIIQLRYYAFKIFFFQVVLVRMAARIVSRKRTILHIRNVHGA